MIANHSLEDNAWAADNLDTLRGFRY